MESALEPWAERERKSSSDTPLALSCYLRSIELNESVNCISFKTNLHWIFRLKVKIPLDAF